MRGNLWMALALGLALGVGSVWTMPALAQETESGEEVVFGSQLMTQQERAEYRQRLMNATSAEERERIRAEHHARMMERAKERGVTLPDEPPMRRMHEGMGGGMGGGGMRGK